MASPSKELLLEIRERVIEGDLEGCGFVRAVEKGCWELMKRVKIYGLIVDTGRVIIEVPEEKIQKVQEELFAVENLEEISARRLVSIAGKFRVLPELFTSSGKISRVLFNRRYYKSDSTQMGQECVVDEESLRGYKVVKRKYERLEWEASLEVSTYKSSIRGCIDDSWCGVYSGFRAAENWLGRFIRQK